MIAAPIMITIQKTPAQGAYCSVHVATSPELEGLGGAYYVQSKKYPLREAATSAKNAERLWEESLKLVGLK
jgi:retinol dehydrogenase 14